MTREQWVMEEGWRKAAVQIILGWTEKWGLLATVTGGASMRDDIVGLIRNSYPPAFYTELTDAQCNSIISHVNERLKDYYVDDFEDMGNEYDLPLHDEEWMENVRDGIRSVIKY